MKDSDAAGIDLRSDTLTLPTAAMRRAMAAAKVGDDVFGEDPTVIALERRVAELLGKEAAVFVPSGTMSNQLAVRAHTEPGDEVFVETNAHLYYYEAGAPAALSGVMCRCLSGERGIFHADDLAAAIRPANLHFPRPRLVCLENTHNRGGGSVWSLRQIAEVTAVARKNRLFLHLDGARLWNAAVATNVSEREYARPFDSVSVCFSKGLGAPVGSALAGARGFIERARRFRKQWGGGMRQAGVVAAGALYALEHHRQRLADDHARARRLALALAELPGITLNPDQVETNIVRFQVGPGRAQDIADRLERKGVRILAVSPDTLRAVTHLNLSNLAIQRAIAIFRSVLQSC